jgi:uncharacterized membrane protein YfcA
MWTEFLEVLPASTLAMLWAGAFLGGLAAGAAGFAFGIVGSAIWLHAMAPLHATMLVVTGGLIIQLGTIWPLRRSIDVPRHWGFFLAGLVGIPIGVLLLVRTDALLLKASLGVFLASYGAYALLAPRLPRVAGGGRAADAAVGFFGGILGGVGGYSGVLPAIWAQLRGWPKDFSRAFYQPFILMAHIATILLIGAVALDRKGLILFVAAVPALLLGGWVGWTIYGRLDERRFRQFFAVLLLLSGAILML